MTQHLQITSLELFQIYTEGPCSMRKRTVQSSEACKAYYRKNNLYAINSILSMKSLKCHTNLQSFPDVSRWEAIVNNRGENLKLNSIFVQIKRLPRQCGCGGVSSTRRHRSLFMYDFYFLAKLELEWQLRISMPTVSILGFDVALCICPFIQCFEVIQCFGNHAKSQ